MRTKPTPYRGLVWLLPSLDTLAQHGGNPHLTDGCGRKALHHAVRWGIYDTARHLTFLHHVDPDSQDHDHTLIIRFGKRLIIKIFLQFSAGAFI